ncbi:nuclease-related domain-containing protein [Pseudonocardia acidicola]|uniref:NERD domain-containing protein n=1 Tax=Pseudonocardia acidicola TaxID=2724939 RepID=A0ABX1S8T2_9PSEU|nr:nuclease-related domain-containing protein [Pseudonocardia acidicola]NMH96568.1 NERD domain-containing protein [Pseudonocardia acidicola]
MVSPEEAGTRAADGPGWRDLAANVPGISITHEAARRRHAEGAGADRSWRIGADGEHVIAGLLAELATPSRLDRLRRRGPRWRVLHSVPIGHGRADIDHVLVGPPGVVTINTKHHHRGRLVVESHRLIVNGRRTDYITRSQAEGASATRALQAALHYLGERELARQLTVRPMIAVVGGVLQVWDWPGDVSIVTTTSLLRGLRALPGRFDAREVDAIYEIARRSTTWLHV